MFLLCSAEEDFATAAAGEFALPLTYGGGEGAAAGRASEVTGLPSVAESSADPFPAFCPEGCKTLPHVVSPVSVALASRRIRVKYAKYLAKDRRINPEIRITSATRNQVGAVRHSIRTNMDR